MAAVARATGSSLTGAVSSRIGGPAGATMNEIDSKITRRAPASRAAARKYGAVCSRRRLVGPSASAYLRGFMRWGSAVSWWTSTSGRAPTTASRACERDDLVSRLEQPGDQRTADGAGRAGDE